MIHTGELGKSWKSTEEMFERHFLFMRFRVFGLVCCVCLLLLFLLVLCVCWPRLDENRLEFEE